VHHGPSNILSQKFPTVFVVLFCFDQQKITRHSLGECEFKRGVFYLGSADQLVLKNYSYRLSHSSLSNPLRFSGRFLAPLMCSTTTAKNASTISVVVAGYPLPAIISTRTTYIVNRSRRSRPDQRTSYRIRASHRLALKTPWKAPRESFAATKIDARRARCRRKPWRHALPGLYSNRSGGTLAAPKRSLVCYRHFTACNTQADTI